LFYEFSLERHVPADRLLRSIYRVVDLSDVRAHQWPFYGEIGRSSIDPELMIRSRERRDARVLAHSVPSTTAVKGQIPPYRAPSCTGSSAPLAVIPNSGVFTVQLPI